MNAKVFNIQHRKWDEKKILFNLWKTNDAYWIYYIK